MVSPSPKHHRQGPDSVPHVQVVSLGRACLDDLDDDAGRFPEEDRDQDGCTDHDRRRGVDPALEELVARDRRPGDREARDRRVDADDAEDDPGDRSDEAARECADESARHGRRPHLPLLPDRFRGGGRLLVAGAAHAEGRAAHQRRGSADRRVAPEAGGTEPELGELRREIVQEAGDVDRGDAAHGEGGGHAAVLVGVLRDPARGFRRGQPGVELEADRFLAAVDRGPQLQHALADGLEREPVPPALTPRGGTARPEAESPVPALRTAPVPWLLLVPDGSRHSSSGIPACRFFFRQ